MQFKAQPCIFDAEFFLQRIDNALADVTERSDVVGKYSHLKDHYPYSLQSELYSNTNLIPRDLVIATLCLIVQSISVSTLEKKGDCSI
jgi:hypothetical protein